MKLPNVLNGGWLWMEIRPGSLEVLQEAEYLAIPLERQAGGRLTNDCKERVAVGLRDFLKKKTWRPRLRGLCAIDARGVSLRRLNLPASAHQDAHRVLRLQIEREFPLPPEALAWGYSRIVPLAGAVNGRDDWLVAALKKEVLEDYAAMFADCGVSPVFTLAALARSRLCPHTKGSYGLLDIGGPQSELICFDNGSAESVRVLAWGGDHITRAIEQGFGVGRAAAEELRVQAAAGSPLGGNLDQKLRACVAKAIESLAQALSSNWRGQRLYLTGADIQYLDLTRALAERLGGGVNCQCIEAPPSPLPRRGGKGRDEGAALTSSAAILGLKMQVFPGDASSPLILRLKDSGNRESLAHAGQNPLRAPALLFAQAREMAGQPFLRKWLRLAVALGIVSICFPYAEALVLKPFLAKRLAAINAEKGRLSIIDRELGFLQFLKKSQPPYLDALTVLANSAPPGTRFDSVSLNRLGDLSLKGNMHDAQQVVDFRSKLVKSGFFSTVSVEDETPSPDRQKIAVRITAQWKPAGTRPFVKVEPLPPGAMQGGPATPFPGIMEGGPPAFFPGPNMPTAMPVMGADLGGQPGVAPTSLPPGAGIVPGRAGTNSSGTPKDSATDSGGKKAIETSDSKKGPDQ